MQVEVADLDDGRMPERYSVDGQGHSPPIRWSGAPDGTKDLVVFMETIGPGGEIKFTHWVAWGIDPSRGSLDAGFQGKAEPDEPRGMRQGTADAGQTGYEPPVGTLDRAQPLRIRLLALNNPLGLPAGAKVEDVHSAVSSLVIDEAKTQFNYVRDR